MKIKAAIAKLPGADFAIEPLDLSEPRPDEILVRIAAVGLCHTDLGVRDNPVGLTFLPSWDTKGRGWSKGSGRRSSRSRPAIAS